MCKFLISFLFALFLSGCATHRGGAVVAPLPPSPKPTPINDEAFNKAVQELRDKLNNASDSAEKIRILIEAL